MNRIACLGSLNADLVATVERHPEPGETVMGTRFATICGGKGANQAYAAARLGATVAMIGRVGDDAHGGMLCRNLESAGVDVSGVRVTRGVASGTAIITVDAARQNRIVVIPGANGRLDEAAARDDVAAIRGAAILLCQLETPLDAVAFALSEAKRAGAITILDPAPARDLPDEVLRQVDYLTPNESELAALAGRPVRSEEIEAAARALIARGVGKVIAKLGPGGAALVSADGCWRIAGFPVEAVDTTAAGDCFNGAFATGIALGLGEGEALRYACAAAAISVTRFGAQPSMPSAAEVEAFLKERSIGRMRG